MSRDAHTKDTLIMVRELGRVIKRGDKKYIMNDYDFDVYLTPNKKLVCQVLGIKDILDLGMAKPSCDQIIEFVR